MDVLEFCIVPSKRLDGLFKISDRINLVFDFFFEVLGIELFLLIVGDGLSHFLDLHVLIKD